MSSAPAEVSSQLPGAVHVEMHWYERAGVMVEPKVKFPEFNVSIPFRLPFP